MSQGQPGRTWARRPHFDGLRAIAAGLVVVFHAGLGPLSYGFVGVDAFFVLSGFLITGLLLEERARTGTVALLAFFARRVRRLLPAALFILLAVALVWPLVFPPLQVAQVLPDLYASALYYSNWHYLWSARDYFHAGGSPSPLLHFWSLAVEEQFYLLWPALVLVAARFRFRALWWLGVGTTVGLAAYTSWLSIAAPMHAHFGTDARLVQLMLGAMVALWRHQHPRPAATPSWARTLGTAGALALVLASATPIFGSNAGFHGMMAAIGTALFVGLSESSTGGVLVRWLGSKPMVALGRSSYSAYLWHWPLLLVLEHNGSLPGSPWLRALALWSITTLLALGSHRWIEQTVSAMKIGGRARQIRWLLAGLAASIATAVLGAWLMRLPEGNLTRYLGPTVRELPLQPEALAPRNGAQPLVLLAGDSHAEHLWPAVRAAADAHGWDARLFWAAECGWMDMPEEPHGLAHLPDCEPAFRAPLLEFAQTVQPSLILLALRPRSLFNDSAEVAADGPVPAGFARLLDRRTLEQAAALTQGGAQLVLVEPVPELQLWPEACVDRQLGAADCPQEPAKRRGDVELRGALRGAAAGLPGVSSLDLGDVLCPGNHCPTIQRGMLTRSDDNHLLPAYAATLAQPLGEALVAAGMDLERARLTTP